MSNEAEVKPLSDAEMETLLNYVIELRAAQEAQDKFVTFLRKQHNAPAKDGWGLTDEGFKKSARHSAPASETPEEGAAENG